MSEEMGHNKTQQRLLLWNMTYFRRRNASQRNIKFNWYPRTSKVIRTEIRNIRTEIGNTHHCRGKHVLIVTVTPLPNQSKLANPAAKMRKSIMSYHQATGLPSPLLVPLLRPTWEEK